MPFTVTLIDCSARYGLRHLARLFEASGFPDMANATMEQAGAGCRPAMQA
jgi:hypothetical protein